jgi:hypothetical protein
MVNISVCRFASIVDKMRKNRHDRLTMTRTIESDYHIRLPSRSVTFIRYIIVYDQHR